MIIFDPRMDDEVSNNKVAEKIIFPDGEYDFVVKFAKQKVSKAGNECILIIINCSTSDAQQQTDVFCNLMVQGKMKYLTKHFCESTGFLDVWNTGKLDADFLKSAKGRVNLVTEDNATYGRRNVVKDFIVADAKTKSEDNSDIDKFDDQIPF